MRLANYFELPELTKARPGLRAAVEEFRRSLVLSALSRNGGNRQRAARELGIGLSTLKNDLARQRDAA